MKIAIDFVAGSHGNFLETICNRGFGFTSSEDNFSSTGTSHVKSNLYKNSRVFFADHYFQRNKEFLNLCKQVISIRFSQQDLLMLSSVSLLRAGDYNIHNDQLEVNTVAKLSNKHYFHVLKQIKDAYPFIDLSTGSIPRYVLREFYKFGFRDPDTNGYWTEQARMQYPTQCQVFKFDYRSFYNHQEFVQSIKDLENFLDMQFEFDDDFHCQYQKFLTFVPFLDHKKQCDQIIESVCIGTDSVIPTLTLFQESYINGHLEKIFNKEMPFHQDRYFTSTKDMLHYINNSAPNL